MRRIIATLCCHSEIFLSFGIEVSWKLKMNLAFLKIFISLALPSSLVEQCSLKCQCLSHILLKTHVRLAFNSSNYRFINLEGMILYCICSSYLKSEAKYQVLSILRMFLLITSYITLSIALACHHHCTTKWVNKIYYMYKKLRLTFYGTCHGNKDMVSRIWFSCVKSFSLVLRKFWHRQSCKVVC